MHDLSNTLWKSGACTVANRKSGSYSIKALNGSISGLDELLAKLDMLPELAAEAAKEGITASVNQIKQNAKGNVRDERIEPRITSKVEREGAKVTGTVFVQPGDYHTPLWPVYYEMGTGPKGIASGGDKYPLPASAYTQTHWYYWDKKLNHVVRTEGRYARPYLWPAYLAEKPFIMPRVKDAIAAYMTKTGGGGK